MSISKISRSTPSAHEVAQQSQTWHVFPHHGKPQRVSRVYGPRSPDMFAICTQKNSNSSLDLDEGWNLSKEEKHVCLGQVTGKSSTPENPVHMCLYMFIHISNVYKYNYAMYIHTCTLHTLVGFWVFRQPHLEHPNWIPPIQHWNGVLAAIALHGKHHIPPKVLRFVPTPRGFQWSL